MLINYPAETLLIEGPDAVAFAQAQFSSSVDSLSVKHWQFSAWLDAQGRVLAFFHLARLDEHRLLLLLRGGTSATMTQALQRFVFRSKLTVTALPTRTLSTGPALEMHSIAVAEGIVSLGFDAYAMQIVESGASDEKWREPQLKAGWPWLPKSALGELLAPALSLQRLDAVAVDKGCYPGQEIVARLHFRGGLKKHLYTITLSHLISPGESLRTAEHEEGRVVDVLIGDTNIYALAILNDELVKRAKLGPLAPFDDGLSIRLAQPWSE